MRGLSGRSASRSEPWLVVLLALALPWPARAVDTMEPWSPGALDVEAYLGADGLGGGESQLLFGDLMVGYGMERISVFLGTRFEAYTAFSSVSPGLRLGAFGTALDAGWLKLDLVAEAGAEGERLSQLHLALGTELNVDLRSPLGPWGFYLRAQVPFTLEGSRTAAQLDLTPGVWWTVREGHQLLAEVRTSVLPPDAEAPWRWESAGVAVGYNVVLSESLELVAEASAGPAGGGVAVGASVGVIATLPGS